MRAFTIAYAPLLLCARITYVLCIIKFNSNIFVRYSCFACFWWYCCSHHCIERTLSENRITICSPFLRQTVRGILFYIINIYRSPDMGIYCFVAPAFFSSFSFSFLQRCFWFLERRMQTWTKFARENFKFKLIPLDWSPPKWMVSPHSFATVANFFDSRWHRWNDMLD